MKRDGCLPQEQELSQTLLLHVSLVGIIKQVDESAFFCHIPGLDLWFMIIQEPANEALDQVYFPEVGQILAGSGCHQ